MEHLTTEINSAVINCWSTGDDLWSNDFASGRQIGDRRGKNSRLGHIDQTPTVPSARSSHYGPAVSTDMPEGAPKWQKSGEDRPKRWTERWTTVHPVSCIWRTARGLAKSDTPSVTDSSASISATSDLPPWPGNLLNPSRAPPRASSVRHAFQGKADVEIVADRQRNGMHRPERNGFRCGADER